MSETVSVPRATLASWAENLNKVQSEAFIALHEIEAWLDAEPLPSARRGLLTSAEELAKLPRDTKAAKNVEAWAKRNPRPEIGHNTGEDVTCLARVMWFGNRVDATVENIIDTLPGAPRTYNALSLGRSLPAYIFAADLLDYRPQAFLAWLAEIRGVVFDEGGGRHSLISAAESKPNNWGAAAGAGRIAIDLFIGDTDDLRKAADVFYGFLGDRNRWSEWKWGEDTWWHNMNPVPITIKGAIKRGMPIDGVIVDDLRRGDSPFPQIHKDGISYSWECLQGLVLSAIMLDRERKRTGAVWLPDPWTASDSAILRAVKFLYSIPNGMGQASGDDAGTLWVIRRFCGWTPGHPLIEGCPPAKNCGFYDFIFGAQQ